VNTSRSRAEPTRERWSMDFMLDTLADGRGFPTLNIVDELHARVRADRSRPHAHDAGARQRGPHLPVGRSTRGRIVAASSSAFIRPCKPIENACVESFNGKFRDECLNERWLLALPRRSR
jgi:putative transposase